MGLQETADIILTFLQNIVLLVDIPNLSIKWPAALEEPINYVKMVVSFDFLKEMVSKISLQVDTLDIHVMLALKNALLPFAVSALIIIPLQRWYYVVWWLFTLLAAVGATVALAATSLFAQQPTQLNGVRAAHGHAYIYTNSYDPIVGLASEPNRDVLNSTFQQTAVMIAGGVAIGVIIMFFVLISIGIALWIIQSVRARKKKAAALTQRQKQAPPGKKVNRQNFEFQYTYNEIQQKVAMEKQLNVGTYISRIAPLFGIIVVAMMVIGLAIYLYIDITNKTSPDGTQSSSETIGLDYVSQTTGYSYEGTAQTTLMIFIITLCICVGIIVVAIIFVGFNSLVLFEKPRAFVYKLKNFLTSKSLKLVFLVLSSFYIPLAVQIFTMFDCVTISCNEGQRFNNRKDNSAGIAGYEQYFTKLLQDPTTCQTCHFDQLAIVGTNTTLANYTSGVFSGMKNATIQAANQTMNSLCNNTAPAMLTSICPAATEYRLSRSSFIACSNIYPYVGIAALLCLLFVLFTPFLILYLIITATKMLNTVIVSHLFDLRQRKALRRKLRKKRRFKKGQNRLTWQDLHDKLSSMSKHDATEYYNNMVKDVKLRNERDLKWEMRIQLVDCSIESLYFPYKYFFRYYKLLFMFAKVVLAFTNVFGVTFFGFIPSNSTIGGQVVLWTTFAVQIVLGLITVILRPHMVLAESLLMFLSSISICANSLFGLFILYSNVDVPWFVTTAFMAANTLVLGCGAAASLFFYFFRIINNSYKKVQHRMKRLLKNRVSKILETRKKALAAERRKARKSRQRAPRMSKKKQEITPEDLMPTGKQIRQYFKQKKEPVLPLFPSKYTYDTVKSLIQYQKTVAYTLNRQSLNVLINFFFVLSIVSVVAGLLIAMHYLVQYTTPYYTDPYIQTPIQYFKKPVNFHRVWEYTDQDFSMAHTNPQFRNATEHLVEKYAGFQRFSYDFCDTAFDYHFAEYNNWDDFTDNCCCTRDHEYESQIKTDSLFSMIGTIPTQDLVVENWRCKNGFVKRRLRQVRFNFTAPSPEPSEFRFKVHPDNYGLKTINGFGARGLCSKEFNTGMSMARYNRTSFCAALSEAGTGHNAGDPTFMIAPEYTLLDAVLYRDYVKRVSGNYSTEGYQDQPIDEQKIEFWGTTLDSYFSLLTRAFLY